jgi:Plasmid replication region DNA-binding N-term
MSRLELRSVLIVRPKAVHLITYITSRYCDNITYMASSKFPDDDSSTPQFSGRDVIYRDSAISVLDVQRAADALLRQGIKPSVAAVREQLGGGSPNTLTPLLSKYWETLGQRLGAGPESLERVPESLARVTELLWRRALEEARERLKLLLEPGAATNQLLPLQEQVMKLSVALAEARAREGEQLTHLAGLSKERESLRTERASLLALLKGTQTMLEQQGARLAALERERAVRWSPPRKTSSRGPVGPVRSPKRKSRSVSVKRKIPKRKKTKIRKPK